MTNHNRLIEERSIDSGIMGPTGRRERSAAPVRSVAVNLAESPLGWLFSRGHLTRRQFDAGERLRNDWERAPAAPSRSAGHP